MNVDRARRPYLWVWLGLLLLLAVSVASAFVPLGWGNAAINLGVATAKAALVALYFMHLRTAPATLRLAGLLGLIMLGLLLGLSAADYATRARSPAPWQAPQSESALKPTARAAPAPAAPVLARRRSG